MHSIKTISNNKIKEIIKLHQKKYRDEMGLFIAEGDKVLEELIRENIEIKDIISVKQIDIHNLSTPITIVDESTMKKISTTDSPCELLCVAKKREIKKENFVKLNKIALFDSISDPGNLGTIIRSAAAFGIEGIILYGNCVDLYSSKVIRSSTGNFFKVPIIKIKDINGLTEIFDEHTKIATALSKDNNISLKECSNIEKFIIMFGSEAKGLSNDLISVSEKNIKLEMLNNVESLNLSVSSSIIFYELFIN